jgi:hypothetical protein
MPISLQCTCGKAYRIKDELAGKKIRCSACNKVIAVPIPEPETPTEEDAMAFLLTDDAPAATSGNNASSTDIQEHAPLPKSDDRVIEKPPAPKPAKEKKRASSLQKLRWKDFDDGRDQPPAGSGRSISPTLVTGLLMMLGAVIWFVGGLAIGILFYYPPVLFVLGIIAVFKGAMGQEDS